MGVDLSELVPRKTVELQALPKEGIAIDGNNALYQFLTVIRQPDGTPLMNTRGQITSHLQGLFYRTINFIELGLRPIYVFDGEVLPLKRQEIAKRSERREKAKEEAERAKELGLYEEAYKKSVQAARLDKQMVEQAKKLLQLMGVPFVDAPFEGEAQAAKIVLDGKAYACVSQDYDSLLFGAPRLIRNLTISGKRKLPNKNEYIEIKPEIIELNQVLSTLGLERRQLIWLAILIGTDYNPEGFPNIGPKTALKLIKQYGTLQKVLEVKGLKPDFDLEAVEQEFLNPHVKNDYEIVWGNVQKDAIINYLCEEQDFSRERVEAALQRLIKARSGGFQQTLEKWFS
ncbi:flap endonuclease-1 [Candidatus Marsarchaeota G1 archaeon OSP_B]|jgi:flap endonuclease-1|uniref:Flap endonuclease 1 n=4 Tax=Candidatus Marsarchaeota group 1 TaxID=2203770 RepID=A0A2R6AKM1_9ARCH|nr:MAG: flap endonuclease-1 [Candidatus Marsarchaeota G1 archaeon OSP_D]PSN86930.1 MAG: flap endonuclease-1 [Candidatus Marsarchaeota G1 archaeon BE_D]PSN89592.1 MAG: flap endonuclease-1 [Candidatus Marsarchaeota G1 archaeon OSP_C]PSN91142.1 MAG: flap endonuclease-1 [Candidatus Marsarchaeota G1 archaeon OSP_B]